MNDVTRIRLTLSGVAYLIMTIVHDLDHLRQGRPLALEVKLVGVVAVVTAVVVIALAVRGHRLAPHAAVVVGIGSLAGLVVVHLVPRWSAISDPYGTAQVDALSYGILYALMASGAYLAYEGLRSLRAPQPAA